MVRRAPAVTLPGAGEADTTAAMTLPGVGEADTTAAVTFTGVGEAGDTVGERGGARRHRGDRETHAPGTPRDEIDTPHVDFFPVPSVIAGGPG
jgi:hypothetical protein